MPNFTIFALALTLIALPPKAKAQDQSKQPRQQPEVRQANEPQVRRVVLVKHQNVERLGRLARSFVQARFDDVLGVIVLTGDEQAVDEAEAMIRSLDKPGSREPAGRLENVELTIHLLGAVEEGGSDFADSPLRAVVEQLRSRFSHGGYRLLDSLMLRGRDGQQQVRGALPDISDGDDSRVNYNVRATLGVIPEQAGYRVRIGVFSLKMYRVGSGVQDLAELETRLDIPTDKLVVVGKAGVDDPLMQGLFVVLSARVVE